MGSPGEGPSREKRGSMQASDLPMRGVGPRRRQMRPLAIGSLGLSFLAATAARAQPPATEALPSLHVHPAGDPSQLGRVDFPVSCTPAAQAKFNLAVAILHSFWYEESEK